MYCDVIFLLDNGTELKGKKKIEKHLDSFPTDILEKIKPVFFDTLSKTKGWNRSVIRVKQNGKYEIKMNIKDDLLFID